MDTPVIWTKVDVLRTCTWKSLSLREMYKFLQHHSLGASRCWLVTGATQGQQCLARAYCTHERMLCPVLTNQRCSVQVHLWGWSQCFWCHFLAVLVIVFSRISALIDNNLQKSTRVLHTQSFSWDRILVRLFRGTTQVLTHTHLPAHTHINTHKAS